MQRGSGKGLVILIVGIFGLLVVVAVGLVSNLYKPLLFRYRETLPADVEMDLGKGVLSETKYPFVKKGEDRSDLKSSEQVSLTPVIVFSKGLTWGNVVYAEVEGVINENEVKRFKIKIYPTKSITAKDSAKEFYDSLKIDGKTYYALSMIKPRSKDLDTYITKYCEKNTKCIKDLKKMASKNDKSSVYLRNDIDIPDTKIDLSDSVLATLELSNSVIFDYNLIRSIAFPYSAKGTQTALISPYTIKSKNLDSDGIISLSLRAQISGVDEITLNVKVFPVKPLLGDKSLQDFYDSLKADNKTLYFMIVTMPHTIDLDQYISVLCSWENSKCKEYVSNMAQSNTDKKIDINKLLDGKVNGSTLELGDILLPTSIREVQ